MNQSITKVWSQHLPQSADLSPKHTSSVDYNSNAIPLTSNSPNLISLITSKDDKKEKFKNQRKSKIKSFRTESKKSK